MFTAIVVGGGVNALGVLRSLAQADVSVCVLDTDLRSPAMRSRHANARLVATLEGPEFMAELQQVAKSCSHRAVLFLTEEKTVNTVSKMRSALPATLQVRLPDHDRLNALMHKQGFYDLAAAIDAPVPRTVRLQGLEDLANVGDLSFPCVLKPSEKSYAYGAKFEKAYKVESPSEVVALYREIEPVLADMVVQEWIEGSDAEIYFCLQYIGADGTVVASFPGRKIRSWPPRIGGTASCTAAWEHAKELSAITADFFHRVGFQGMGSMEYKRDARDGRFYMVEPTVGRTDFQQEVATVNGCNLPFAAYCHEMGLPAPVVRPEVPPKVWRDTQTDNWAQQEAGGHVDAASSALAVVDAYRRWNDPRPWLDHLYGRLRQRIQR